VTGARMQRVNARVNPDELHRINHYADILGITVSELIRDALDDYLPQVPIPRRPWTRKDDRRVQALCREGHSYRTIGAMMGRSKWAVFRRVKTFEEGKHD